MSDPTPIVVVQPPAPPPVVLVAPPGPPGPAGGAPVPVEYDLVGVSDWSTVHAFPYAPELQLVDAAGARVYAQAVYLDGTHVSVTFPAPFTGKVILR